MKFLKRFLLARKKLFFLILLLTCLLIVIKIYLSIKVSKIICLTQNNIKCDARLTDSLSPVEGKTFFSAKRTGEKILKENLTVSKYSLRYIFPDILEVKAYVKTPKFVIEPKGGGFFYQVDKDGFILEKQTSTNLIVLQTGKEQYEIGKNVDEEELFALKILEGVYNMYQVKYGILSAGVLKIRSDEGIELIFPTSGERDVLLGSARLILSRLNKISQESKIERIGSIDLRFKNPIIK